MQSHNIDGALQHVAQLTMVIVDLMAEMDSLMYIAMTTVLCQSLLHLRGQSTATELMCQPPIVQFQKTLNDKIAGLL